MKMFKATLAICFLMSSTQAVQLEQTGIFDKLYKEEAEAAAIQHEKEESIRLKKIQLAEAEKEHDRLVAEEEAEDQKKKEEEEKAIEERQQLQKQIDAEKRKAQIMAEIDRENVALRS